MKISKENIILLLGWMLLALAILLMAGCSAAKKAAKAQTALNKSAVKVANNKEATGYFFDEYALNNDISKGEVVYLPGEEIIKEKTIFDTIYLQGKGTVIREKYYTDRLRVDSFFSDSPKTLSVLKLSMDQNDRLNYALDSLNFQIVGLNKTVKSWKTEAYVHRGIWIAIILFFAIRLFIKVIRPLLKIYFKI